jgi:uncharacterized protein (TIGR02996 family)
VDDAAYLCAVCWAPLDDGPRLVYADWLDERGECARAEFIRVQCELARLPDCGHNADRIDWWAGKGLGGGTYSCNRCWLRQRERELLLSPPPGSAYSRAEFWTPTALRSGAVACEVSTHPPTFRSLRSGMAWDFRRGLVGSVTLTCQQFFGGPCESCGGTGCILDPKSGEQFYDPCPACLASHGEARVGGLAAALFRAAPITEVRLSDRGPGNRSGSRRAWWYTDPDWHRPGAQQHWLPVELRPYLTGRTCEPIDEPRPGVCGFDYGDLLDQTDGVELARADCSAACVAVGRARADLPALARPVSADAPGPTP